MGHGERLALARSVLQGAQLSGHFDEQEQRPWPVPEVLHGVLPHGVTRGSVVVVRGSTSLLLSMIGAISEHRVWTAVVGMPEVGLEAAQQHGLCLERLVVVPRVDGQSAAVVGALVEGMDVVVCGPDVTLTETEQRRLTARVRRSRGVLLSVRPWPEARHNLAAARRQWKGLDLGYGRLRDFHLEVTQGGQEKERWDQIAPWARRAG